jgi:uncharacterized YigZ family protein
MYTINNAVEVEQIINKSRFITYLFPVATEDEAKDKLSQIKAKHSDATHNCYGYIVGKTGNIAKFSDDGEPSGTAGVVIFDVLQKNNLTNILAIVTRYFGGIKLGAGGLVRAYSSSVALAIDQATKVEIIEYSNLEITCDYSILGVIEKYIEGYEIKEKQFSYKVTIIIKIPTKDATLLQEKLINISKNQVLIKID